MPIWVSWQNDYRMQAGTPMLPAAKTVTIGWYGDVGQRERCSPDEGWRPVDFARHQCDAKSNVSIDQAVQECSMSNLDSIGLVIGATESVS